MTTISVIITAFNVGEYLEQALGSVTQQNRQAQEIIVVDDGSTDDSLIKAYKLLLRGRQRFKLVAQNNSGGPGGARNTGIRVASGEYVVFLDGDDWLAPQALFDFSRACESGTPDAIYSNRVWYQEARGRYLKEQTFRRCTFGPVAERRELLLRFAVSGKAFRRQFLLDNALWFPEEMIWEDYPFSHGVLGLAKSITVMTESTYIARRRHGKNRSATQLDRLSDFNLESRFRQILLDRDIVTSTGLPLRFPQIDFGKIDFERRLMVDVKYLARGSHEAALRRAFKKIRLFLLDQAPFWRDRIEPGIAAVYESIVSDDLQDCNRLLRWIGH